MSAVHNISTKEFSTGSMTNLIVAHQRGVTPVVGMGATVLLYSDRHAGTVVKVQGKKLVWWQADTVVRTDRNGCSEDQLYTYTRNLEGDQMAFTLRKNGAWVREGSDMKNGWRLWLGQREEYYDYTR